VLCVRVNAWLTQLAESNAKISGLSLQALFNEVKISG
jgi:hypothetical protein